MQDSLFEVVESIAVTYPGSWITWFVVLVRFGISNECTHYAMLDGRVLRLEIYLEPTSRKGSTPMGHL